VTLAQATITRSSATTKVQVMTLTGGTANNFL
jgi:hypothetical protein